MSEPSARQRPGGRVGNLPAQINSFVGREDELVRIHRIMSQARLLTLTGFGGVGKTRLAARAAEQLSPGFADGAWLLPLAELRDPALLPHTIVDALGLSQRSARDPMTTLREHLRAKRILLVFDNCEHLAQAAAQVATDLLQAADQLRILATSRQRLGIPGETLLQVAPLPVPADANDAERFPAVRLFADRAAAVVEGFRLDASNVEAVTRLCQRLEGMPLALELAAVRLRILAVGDLAERLDDRLSMLSDGRRAAPERHRALRSTIDWSHDLCTAQEQLLWARLSVFSGSFDLEAIQSVCCDSTLSVEDVLETLAGLIDKSIVTAEEAGGHARFRLLETIREYGLTRLRRAEAEQVLRARHRDWYLALVDRSCAEWFGRGQQAWCNRLRLEQPNLRAALETSVAGAPIDAAGLALVGRPWFLWVCMYLAEGRHWLDQALAGVDEPGLERTQALATAAFVASLQGDRTGAEVYLARCRAARAAVPDPLTDAYVDHVHGVYLLFFGPAHESRRMLESALHRYELATVPQDLPVVARIELGLSLVFSGDVDVALAVFEACRRRSEDCGERWLLSYSLYGLALAHFANHELAPAMEHLSASLGIKRVFGDTLGLSMALDLAAWIRSEQGQAESAATLLGAAAQQWRSFGVELFGSQHWLVHRHSCEQRVRAGLAERFEPIHARGTDMPIDAAIGCALQEAGTPADAGVANALSPREREVAGLVAQGMANKSIAVRLTMSQRTAEAHVQHILTKLGFTSRSQIATWVGEQRGAGSWPPN